jgi:hypothetical protein
MPEHPEYTEVKSLALKIGVSGDYYLKSTDRWYAVAVNSETGTCTILGWYDGEIKRQSPDVALQCSVDLWKQLINPDQGVPCASYL